MGTLIHTSDGQNVRLPGESEPVLGEIANALSNTTPKRDEVGRSVPAGFMLVVDADGKESWVNATHITRVEST